MRGRIGAVTVVALVGLTTGVTVLVGPAAGSSVDRWSFEDHPVGYPVVDVPALTLESAHVWHRRGFADDLEAQVTLAGIPEATTDAVVRLVFGDELDGACVPELELEAATLEPAAPSTRDGRTISFSTTPGQRAAPWTCAELTLVGADEPDVVLDRLEGELTGSIQPDYITNLRLHRISSQRVQPHRWTTLRIELHNKSTLIPIDSVRITGFGKKIAMRELKLATGLAPGARVIARLRVLLRADTAQQLVVRAIPRSQHAMARVVTRTVWVRPR